MSVTEVPAAVDTESEGDGYPPVESALTADQDAVDDFNAEPDADVGEAAGRSIEDLAADPDTEDDGQAYFVLEDEKPVTIGSLIKRGTPVEYEFKLQSKAIPGAQGMSLMAFSDPERTLVVPGRAGKVEIDPTYNPDGSVKKVTVRASFKPLMAYDARSKAAEVALYGEE